MVSAAQIQVYKFLAQYQGPPLTVNQIADKTGRNASTIRLAVKRLSEKGFITWDKGRCRTISLVYHEYINV